MAGGLQPIKPCTAFDFVSYCCCYCVSCCFTFSWGVSTEHGAIQDVSKETYQYIIAIIPVYWYVTFETPCRKAITQTREKKWPFPQSTPLKESHHHINDHYWWATYPLVVIYDWVGSFASVLPQMKSTEGFLHSYAPTTLSKFSEKVFNNSQINFY